LGFGQHRTTRLSEKLSELSRAGSFLPREQFRDPTSSFFVDRLMKAARGSGQAVGAR